MKNAISGVLIAAILALPLAQAQTVSSMSPAARIALAQAEAQLLTEETQRAFAAAQEAQEKAMIFKMLQEPQTGYATIQQPPAPGQGPYGNPTPGPYTGPPGLKNPQVVLEAALLICEVVIVGFIAYFVIDHLSDTVADIYVVVGSLWDKIFNSPPPNEPAPSTNAVRKLTFTPSPNFLWVGRPTVAVRPCGTNNWMDRLGNCVFTNVAQMTVQCRENLTSPWTNFFTVTTWGSQAGVLTRYKDGNFNPIYTNYVFRSTNGIAWASPPVSILNDPLRPRKFYRTAAIPR